MRESLADDVIAIDRGIVKLLGKLGDEARIDFLSDCPDRKLSEDHVRGTVTSRLYAVKCAALAAAAICAMAREQDFQEPPAGRLAQMLAAASQAIAQKSFKV